MSGSDLVFNYGKGRVAQLYKNVDDGSPANSRIFIIPLLASGLEADSVLIDKTDFADIVSGATNEATAGGWSRKTITSADVAYTVDTGNDRVDLDLPDQTWTAVAASNDVGKIVVVYDPDSTVGTDADLIPLTMHSFDITTDGSDVTMQVAAAGFYRAA